MQRNDEKTGEGAARQRLSDESDSQDTMLHADEEGAARQSDESDFQETKCRRRRSSSNGRMRATFWRTRGSRDMIFVVSDIYNKIGYISRFCACATANRASTAKLIFVLTGARWYTPESRTVRGSEVRTRVRGTGPRSPGPRANVVSSVSRCPRPLVSGRFRPRVQERGALCGQGTLRP